MEGKRGSEGYGRWIFFQEIFQLCVEVKRSK